MKTKRILAVLVVVLAGAGLTWNQWRLNQVVKRLRTPLPHSASTHADAENADRAEAKLRRAEARYNEANLQ